MEPITLVTIVLVAVYAWVHFQRLRSYSRRERGLCIRCGVRPPAVSLGIDRFCERCAGTTQRGYRAAYRFFQFITVMLIIGASAVLLSSSAEVDAAFRSQLLWTVLGSIGIVLWIRYSLQRRDPS